MFHNCDFKKVDYSKALRYTAQAARTLQVHVLELVPKIFDLNGPEQDFPCVLILTGKNLCSLQGTPVLIELSGYTDRNFVVEFDT